MNIVNRIRRSPKKVIAAAVITVAALIIPASLMASSSVLIESDLEVANVTAGDTSYGDSVNACFNDTVKFKVYYHNRELPESGLIAENVSLDINMPSTPGAVQTVTSTVAGSNTNTVVDTSTVNLCREDAYLELVPSTVTWRRNVGTNENVQYQDTVISDRYVTDTGTMLPIEHQQPCFNFESIVTYEARVVVPSLAIEKSVNIAGDNQGWSEQVDAENGDEVEFQIEVINNGNARVEDITIQDQLPAGLSYVPNSTVLISGNHPDGVTISNGETIVSNGVFIGPLNPGINTIITFRAAVDANHEDCNVLTNTAITRGIGIANWMGDTASVEVCNDSQPDPEVNLNLKKYVNDQDAQNNGSAVVVETGDTVSWSIVVANTGPDTATNVVVSDAIPAGIANETNVSATAGSYNAGNDTWTIPSIAANSSVTLTFDTQVTADDGSNVRNVATITGVDQNDADGEGNNTDPAVITVDNPVTADPEVNLSLKKYVNDNDAQNEGSAVVVNSGETVTWKIDVANSGPDQATNIVVTDAIPTGVANETNINASTGSYDAPSNTWTIPSLNAGDTTSLSFDTVVTAGDDAVVTNVATISSVDQNDADGTANNTDPAVVVVDATVTNPDPVHVCAAIFTNVSVLNVGDSVKTTVNVTAQNGATVVSYLYNFGDGNEQTVTTSDTMSMVNHTYSEAGEYTITATITFDVNGSERTETCSYNVRVNAPDQADPVYTCNGLTIVTVDGSDGTFKVSVETTAENGATFKHFVYDFGDGSDELVTDQNMVEYTYAGEGTYRITLRAVFTVDGEMVNAICTHEVQVDEEGEVKGVVVTTPTTTTEVEVCSSDSSLAANDPNCGKPLGVSVLPNTGPGAALLSIFGTGALGVAARGYTNSRKALLKSLTR